MDNYKGIYYKETKEQKYYEGGAHFPYKVLYTILLNLGGTIYSDEYTNNCNKYFPDYLSLKKHNEKNIIKYKTRNIEQNRCINMNNPNTLVKHSSQNILVNREKRKKNYMSRNNYKILYNDNNTDINKRNFATSININQTKKNIIDNHLLKILLNKKDKEKHNEEKNNEENNNNSNNRYSFINFYKNIHYRNKSEFSTNIEINKKINKIEKNDENSKNDFRAYIKNKINLIKNYKNSRHSLENKGKNKDLNTEKQTVNNTNQFIPVQKQNPKLKPCLSYLLNNSKKSRNINNNIIDSENNKNDLNINSQKKAIINNFFKTSDNDISYNNGCTFNMNKGKYFSNYTINKNKEMNTEQKRNNLIFQKYKKKKINQICCFNINNAKSNSGRNIFAKNINKINIIHNKCTIK